MRIINKLSQPQPRIFHRIPGEEGYYLTIYAADDNFWKIEISVLAKLIKKVLLLQKEAK